MCKVIMRIAFFVLLSTNFLLPYGIAQEKFPIRPITLVVGYAPGGASDMVCRSIAPKLGEVLGQPVVVVNKPGAGGIVALSLVAKKSPDGYTLVQATNTALFTAPHQEKIDYDPLNDLTFICNLADQSQFLVVSSGAPWNNLEELLEDAKNNPGKINYGTYAARSPAELFMDALAKERGIKWTSIPFKGDGPCATSLLGGHIHAAGLSSGAIPYLKAGRFRALLALRDTRSKFFPEVKSLRDVKLEKMKGLLSFMTGIAAPKGLPKEILHKYEYAFREAGKSQEFLNICEMLNLEVKLEFGEEYYVRVKEAYEATGNAMREIK